MRAQVRPMYGRINQVHQLKPPGVCHVSPGKANVRTHLVSCVVKERKTTARFVQSALFNNERKEGQN